MCELDSAALRDLLIDQEISVKKLASDLENARKICQVQELGKVVVGETNESEIRVATLELKIARNGVTFAETNFHDAKEARISERRLRDYRIKMLEAENARDDAQRKFDILTKFTSEKRRAEAELAFLQARRAVNDVEIELRKAKDKEASLGRQIGSCRIFAPASGILKAVRLEGFENDQTLLVEGGTARGGQAVFILKPTAFDSK